MKVNVDCNTYARGNDDKRVGIVGLIITLVVMILIVSSQVMYAIDLHFNNQDIMICESVKVSGNEEYLESCACYYKSGDIACTSRR